MYGVRHVFDPYSAEQGSATTERVVLPHARVPKAIAIRRSRALAAAVIVARHSC